MRFRYYKLIPVILAVTKMYIFLKGILISMILKKNLIKMSQRAILVKVWMVSRDILHL